MVARTFRSATLAALLTATACSGHADFSPAPSSADAGSGGSDGSGSSGAGGGGASDPLGWGYVGVIADLTWGHSTAVGTFTRSLPPEPGGKTCKEIHEGACVGYDCTDVLSGSGGGGGSPPWASAGAITLASPLASLSLSINSYGFYDGYGEALWADDNAVTVSIAATGAEVPPFQLAVASPGYITVSSPPFPADYELPMTVDTASDITLAWTGGAAGARVVASLSTDDSSILISCDYPVEAKTGTVPAAALGILPKGSTGSFFITVDRETEAAFDGWEVQFSASGWGQIAGSDMGSSSMNVHFQ